MSEKKESSNNLGLTLGIGGFIAGVYLVYLGDHVIGFFSAIACAGLTYQAYLARRREE